MLHRSKSPGRSGACSWKPRAYPIIIPFAFWHIPAPHSTVCPYSSPSTDQGHHSILYPQLPDHLTLHHHCTIAPSNLLFPTTITCCCSFSYNIEQSKLLWLRFNQEHCVLPNSMGLWMLPMLGIILVILASPSFHLLEVHKVCSNFARIHMLLLLLLDPSQTFSLHNCQPQQEDIQVALLPGQVDSIVCAEIPDRHISIPLSPKSWYIDPVVHMKIPMLFALMIRANAQREFLSHSLRKQWWLLMDIQCIATTTQVSMRLWARPNPLTITGLSLIISVAAMNALSIWGSVSLCSYH